MRRGMWMSRERIDEAQRAGTAFMGRQRNVRAARCVVCHGVLGLLDGRRLWLDGRPVGFLHPLCWVPFKVDGPREERTDGGTD
jgi:hypothetical protein